MRDVTYRGFPVTAYQQLVAAKVETFVDKQLNFVITYEQKTLNNGKTVRLYNVNDTTMLVFEKLLKEYPSLSLPFALVYLIVQEALSDYVKKRSMIKTEHKGGIQGDIRA